MTTLAALWLPILVSAVFVFVVSSVIHMALPIHKGDYGRMPGEPQVLDALRAGAPPGQYRFPYASSMQEFGSPEMQEKMKRGPVGSIVVLGPGGMNMGKSLGAWFAFCIVVGISTAYVAGLVLPPGDGRVFRVTATVATLCHAFSSVNDSIWKGLRWSTTWKFVFDGVLYGLATGAAFAWLWPAAA